MQQRLRKYYENFPYLPEYSSHAKISVADVSPLLVRSRVAPRLTENRVPGGGYPEPSEPGTVPVQLTESRVFLRWVPRYPSTALYGAPKTSVHVDLYTHCSGCASRLFLSLAPADYGPRIDHTPIVLISAFAQHLSGRCACGNEIEHHGSPAGLILDD